MDTIGIKANRSIEMMTNNVDPIVVIRIDNLLAVEMFYNGEVKFGPGAFPDVGDALADVIDDISRNHIEKMRSDTSVSTQGIRDIRKDFRKYLLMIREGFINKETSKNG